MKLTRAKAIALHRELWRRIAEAQKRGEHVRKADIIDKMGYEDVRKNCFLCEYAITCNKCPLDWTNRGANETDGYCWSDGSYYDQWEDCMARDEVKKAAEVAEIIAELPEKPENV